MKIDNSVGYGGRNNSADVAIIQQLLNDNISRVPAMTTRLKVDGKIGPNTRSAIVQFQQKVLGFNDGRVDPGGKTLNALLGGSSSSFPGVSNSPTPPSSPSSGFSYGTGSSEPFDFMGSVATLPPQQPMAPEFFTFPYFYHEGHAGVSLAYVGPSARQMTGTAEQLLKCILASCGIHAANLNSTRRTYHDQARITIDQTYVDRRERVAGWYGARVAEEIENYINPKDIQGFADWWEAYDQGRGRVSSLHLSNQALDVDPAHSRGKFAEKVKELKGVAGSGVRHIIPKGVAGEPVDHVEFTFKICPV